jgi:2'-5' RNA ligase
MSLDPDPFIVTAALDEAGRDWLDSLRRRHFPPGRNLVPAHLTLFHKIPADEEVRLADVVRRVCAATAPMALRGQGPWFLGRGVALRFEAAGFHAVRQQIADTLAPVLTPQDRNAFRAHVTVQNKVDPATARALFEALQHEGPPFDLIAEGLLIWRYRGGPWTLHAEVPFSGEPG